MTKTLVSNAHQLDELLNKKYGERLNTNPFATFEGRVEGMLDSKIISISFEGNKYLLISTTSNSRDVLDELLPLLTEVMGSEKPICSYDLQYEGMEEKDALEYMVYQTTKFGVDLPEPTIDKHITATPSYNAWYGFYSNHFKNVLTDEQWNAFQQAQKAGQDTSAFMPSGHWTDLLEQPTQKALK